MGIMIISLELWCMVMVWSVLECAAWSRETGDSVALCIVYSVYICLYCVYLFILCILCICVYCVFVSIVYLCLLCICIYCVFGVFCVFCVFCVQGGFFNCTPLNLSKSQSFYKIPYSNFFFSNFTIRPGPNSGRRS